MEETVFWKDLLGRYYCLFTMFVCFCFSQLALRGIAIGKSACMEGVLGGSVVGVETLPGDEARVLEGAPKAEGDVPGTLGGARALVEGIKEGTGLGFGKTAAKEEHAGNCDGNSALEHTQSRLRDTRRGVGGVGVGQAARHQVGLEHCAFKEGAVRM